tara:strand:- start:2609 stop:2791 length:183 start_codon:yes stop_codon:yes gene_type:complete
MDMEKTYKSSHFQSLTLSPKCEEKAESKEKSPKQGDKEEYISESKNDICSKSFFYESDSK